MTTKEPHIFKFMSIDGKVFHLRCRTIFETLLDGSLLAFLTLCITIFIFINLLTSALHGGAENMFSSASAWLATLMYFGLALFGILGRTLGMGLIFHRLAKWGLMTTI